MIDELGLAFAVLRLAVAQHPDVRGNARVAGLAQAKRGADRSAVICVARYQQHGESHAEFSQRLRYIGSTCRIGPAFFPCPEDNIRTITVRIPESDYRRLRQWSRHHSVPWSRAIRYLIETEDWESDPEARRKRRKRDRNIVDPMIELLRLMRGPVA